MIGGVQRVMPGVLAVEALAGCDVGFGLAETGDAGASVGDGGVNDGPDASLTPRFCQFEATCGNGVPEVGEQCDDGNNLDGDGCENCMVAPVPL